MAGTEKESTKIKKSDPLNDEYTAPDPMIEQKNNTSFQKYKEDTKCNGLDSEDSEEKPDTAERASDDSEPPSNRETGDQESDKTDSNDVVERKGEDTSFDADKNSQKTDAPDENVSEPARNPDSNEQPNQPLEDVTGDESVPTDADDETDAENDRQQIGAASENTNEGVTPDEESEALTDPVAESETSDEVADQSPKVAAPRRSILKVAVSAVLIAAVFSGFFIFENKSTIKTDESVAMAPTEGDPLSLKADKKEIVDIPSVVTPSIYDAPINEVSTLRNILLKKQAEVLALKKRYRQSIEELEKEILDEQHKADIQTFLQATGNNRIIFSLKTIQRRQSYIGQLEQPLEWVSGACEDLLYIKRRVMMDLQVSAIASGIDMDSHVQHMHQALNKYRPTAEKLAIDPTNARLESLESIWQRTQDRQNIVSPETVYSKNGIIAKQICAGDYNRISELSEITAATAKCITEMQGSDLFLTQITELSPGAARQLCQWKGSWICMNGIKALPPRVAHYLFQWDGDWISLNGLIEFSPEIGEMLLKWRGEQLELMGLNDTADPHTRMGIEYLATWERSGGKLFVPENIRKTIDAWHMKHD